MSNVKPGKELTWLTLPDKYKYRLRGLWDYPVHGMSYDQAMSGLWLLAKEIRPDLSEDDWQDALNELNLFDEDWFTARGNFIKSVNQVW